MATWVALFAILNKNFLTNCVIWTKTGTNLINQARDLTNKYMCFLNCNNYTNLIGNQRFSKALQNKISNVTFYCNIGKLFPYIDH